MPPLPCTMRPSGQSMTSASELPNPLSSQVICVFPILCLPAGDWTHFQLSISILMAVCFAFEPLAKAQALEWQTFV